MLVLVNAGLLGDALCTLPAIATLAARERSAGKVLYVMHNNPEVVRLCPAPENLKILALPQDLGYVDWPPEIKTLSATQAWTAGIGDLHMTQAHFRYLGLPIPTLPLADFTLTYPPCQTESYDFLVAPYSRSDHNNNKLWPHPNWQVIINRLQSAGKRVAILGTHEDPQVYTDVEYIWDQPLALLCAILTQSGALLSCDNGIAHLGAFLGIPHVEIYPQCLPPGWVRNNHPRATTIQADPRTLTVEQVWENIKAQFALST